MDHHLTWSAQINSVCRKVYNALHYLSTLRYFTPQHVRLRLARSQLVPLFDYGDILFGLVSQKNLRKLNLVYNAVTRYVYNLKKYDHISSYETFLLGRTFVNHLKTRICNQTFKILNNPPKYLANFFTYARSTRAPLLIVPRCRSNYLKNSFRQRAIKIWNELPAHCRQKGNYHSFKTCIDTLFK